MGTSKPKPPSPPKPDPGYAKAPDKPTERTLEEVEDYQRGQGKRKQDSEEA